MNRITKSLNTKGSVKNIERRAQISLPKFRSELSQQKSSEKTEILKKSEEKTLFKEKYPLTNKKIKSEELKSEILFSQKQQGNKELFQIDENTNSTLFQLSYQSLRTTSELIKQSTFNKIESEKLLPPFLVIKLPKSLKNLEQACSKIDEFLLDLSPQKPRMDSWANIKNYLQQHNIICQLKTTQYINNLLPNMYTFFEDPLKNLIVGLPVEQCFINTRRQQIKRQLSLHYFERKSELEQFREHNKEQASQQQISDELEDEYLIGRTIKARKVVNFFPIRPLISHTNVAHPQKKIPKQPRQTFLADIGLNVLKSHELYDKILKESSDLTISHKSLKMILKKIKKMYTTKNLTNLFKTTIITHLINQHKYELKIVVNAVQRLILIKNTCLEVVQHHSSDQIIQFKEEKYRSNICQLRTDHSLSHLKIKEELSMLKKV